MTPITALIAYLADHSVPARDLGDGRLNVLTPYCITVKGAAVSVDEWEIIPANLTSVRNYLGY